MADTSIIDEDFIKGRLAEESAVLFDDRTIVRRRTLHKGGYIRVRQQDGTIKRITVGEWFWNPQIGKGQQAVDGQKFKRSVRVLTRQWKRIPDREREPLYEFLRKYTSVKNAKMTCWVENPMVDGEPLTGFWKMLRQFESRYRVQDPNEQGLMQTLMLKGDWELDDVPSGADDDETEGDAAACIASSPLHHIDREIFLGSSEVPSCGHKNLQGHVYEAAGSFSDEDGTWQGHLDDDIAIDPGNFTTCSGSMYSKTITIGGTHKKTTALPTKKDLEARLAELASNKTYNYVKDGDSVTTANVKHTTQKYRDDYGRPVHQVKRNGKLVWEPVNRSPWTMYATERDKYGNAIANAQIISGNDHIDMSKFGVHVDTSADLDVYGMFSTREQQQVAENRHFFFRDGGHVHDQWTYKSWKSAFLPTQDWVAGQTMTLTADMDEDGMFTFTKVVTFAHPWEAWHARKDEHTITATFEFHNRAGNSKTGRPIDIPNAEKARDSACEIVGIAKGNYKLYDPALSIRQDNFEKNEYGLYDGTIEYRFAKKWAAWHARKDEHTLSVVYEFHNWPESSGRPASLPDAEKARDSGCKVVGVAKKNYDKDHAIVHDDFDKNEFGLFDGSIEYTFASEWTVWHAKEDADSLSVVYEFHNSTATAPAPRTFPKSGKTQWQGAQLAVIMGRARIRNLYGDETRALRGDTDSSHALISSDHDINQFGLYDGKVSYIIPYKNVEMGPIRSCNKLGVTSQVEVWRNVPENEIEIKEWGEAKDGGVRWSIEYVKVGTKIYNTPLAGQTLSVRKRVNDFGLYNVTVQLNDQYPQGMGEVYKYTTRKGRFQRNVTRIVDGKEVSDKKGYCYWADVEVKTFDSEEEANSFVTANNTEEFNILKGVGDRKGAWNDGSSVSEEGNGVWVGRKIVHHYSEDVSNLEVAR